jgi:hypothetical protein
MVFTWRRSESYDTAVPVSGIMTAVAFPGAAFNSEGRSFIELGSGDKGVLPSFQLAGGSIYQLINDARGCRFVAQVA